MRNDRWRRWLRLRRHPLDNSKDEFRSLREPQADRVPLLLRLSVGLLPADVREEVLGDLLELWRAEVRHRPWARRVLWLFRQPLSATISRARFRRRGRKTMMSWLDVKLGLRMLARYPGPGIAELAKEARAATGLMQAAFAERYGLPLSTVQDWEQGQRRPDAAARNYAARDRAATRRRGACTRRCGVTARSSSAGLIGVVIEAGRGCYASGLANVLCSATLSKTRAHSR